MLQIHHRRKCCRNFLMFLKFSTDHRHNKKFALYLNTYDKRCHTAENTSQNQQREKTFIWDFLVQSHFVFCGNKDGWQYRLCTWPSFIYVCTFRCITTKTNLLLVKTVWKIDLEKYFKSKSSFFCFEILIKVYLTFLMSLASWQCIAETEIWRNLHTALPIMRLYIYCLMALTT